LVFASGAVGYFIGVREPREVTVKEFSNLEPAEVKPINFGLFWEVWDKLKNEHIDGEKTEPQKMLYGALTGLVGSLGDPNTNFLPPAESKKFLEDVSGRFGGIGAELGTKDGLLVIIAPLKDSPAEKIGLQAGDKILKINDKDATGLDVQEAVKTIRGPIGMPVTLNIFREGWKAPRDFTITRAEIVIPTVDWEMKDGDLVYFRIHSFNGAMLSQFYRALFGAANRGGNGIILDLRNNPGGFLEVSVEMANLFLDNGTEVVSEEFRSGEKRVLRTTGSGALKNVPMVILINGGSASASEILAGAMRDQRGVKLVGEKSFGKGTVQELV
jgi:carboxyl-terminal processing protease